MRKLLLCLAAAVAAAAIAAPAASADFGLKDLDAAFSADAGGSTEAQAGAHPFSFATEFAFQTRDDEERGIEVPDGSTKDMTIVSVPGLAGNPSATPRCTTLEFLQQSCPAASQVGTTTLTYSEPDRTESFPVYNLTAPPGVAAQLGFVVNSLVPVTVQAGVNPNPPYNIVASLTNTSQGLPVYRALTEIWGTPADPAHNSERPGCVGECAAGLAKTPFITLPRACEGPLPTYFKASSWESPGTVLEPPPVFTHDDSTPPAPQGFLGCASLGFAPSVTAQTTSRAADAPSGLDFDLDIDDEGLLSSDGLADSDIKKAVVTLPEGMTLNPSQAEGLGTCSEADLARERADSEPGEGCPEASKVGTLEVQTPLLQDTTLHGALYVATPYENPFDSLIAAYMVVKDPQLGILVRLAGKVEPDPASGQLRAIFGEPGHELPQLPIGHFKVHLREGARSPLVTPPLCGSYEVEAAFTPWAAPGSVYETEAGFEITQGVNGGACPAGGAPPFDPGFQAGSLNNDAGSFSAFQMRLTRRDGDQDLTRFSARLPRGVVARLAGVGSCSEAQIAAAGAKTGRQEQAAPSCPASSRIGAALGGAGVGSQLTYVEGSLYLAGPHQGAPLSVVAIVPAVAGPFDVGNVVVRQALRVDPRSAEVLADGAASDPLPHILAGIPLRVRDIRVHVDRPGFTLNPTSCAPMSTEAQLWGGGLDPFSAFDDAPVGRSARFQAAGCARLGFKPRIALRLRGGTRRGANPALRAVLRPRRGDANISTATVRLPRSAFLDQAHIRTICTRVQFAAKACPKGAIYGRVKAYTPLLAEPLRGPVYLRSSNNKLPDMVFDLHGRVDFEAVARIDSVRGGIRTTFTKVPDAPISRVVLNMQGGNKGLIVNSRDICRAKNRANALLRAHNGRRAKSRPLLRAAGCEKRRARRSSHRRR